MSDENTPRFMSARRVRALDALAPPDYSDPVIEAYKKDVDRTLLRENLKLTVEERFRKLESVAQFARELQDAGTRHRSRR